MSSASCATDKEVTDQRDLEEMEIVELNENMDTVDDKVGGEKEL